MQKKNASALFRVSGVISQFFFIIQDVFSSSEPRPSGLYETERTVQNIVPPTIQRRRELFPAQAVLMYGAVYTVLCGTVVCCADSSVCCTGKPAHHAYHYLPLSAWMVFWRRHRASFCYCCCCPTFTPGRPFLQTALGRAMRERV